MDEQTRANLLQAMHEEAFARAKFLLFAANAEAAVASGLGRYCSSKAKVRSVPGSPSGRQSQRCAPGQYWAAAGLAGQVPP